MKKIKNAAYDFTVQKQLNSKIIFIEIKIVANI